MTAPASSLDRFFGLRARGTTVRREILAGTTTFMTMAYILFVNPEILGSAAGAGHFAAILTSTALVAAVMTAAMGLFANLPLALASGMGLNAVVAFGLVLGKKLTYPQAMGVIVAEGVLITLLVATGLRQAVVRAVPMTLKRAIGIGIGLFLAIIGFKAAGFISAGGALLQLGPEGAAGRLTGFPVVLFALTLVFTAWLVSRGVRGALLIGIAVSTAVAVTAKAAFGGAGFAPHVANLPSSIFGLPDFSMLGQVDFSFVAVLGPLAASLAVFSIMLSDFFDTVGTVVAVGQEAKYLDEQGNFPRASTVLMVDSLAAIAGGLAGASSATTYVESAAGAASGGRTGLTSVTTAALFALCLFISPLAGIVPPQATGAVLVLVGYMMMRDVGAIAWDDPSESIPAFLTVTVMPFTYSITNGIGAGFVSYVLLKLAGGKAREVHPLMIGASVAFVVYFAIGG
ncbi:NCS2 family permease [Anaeromyxobacter dehalogenans]|uniref:Xanthine/uracil/vitamin C transporter n=1 Tax=Anaeromyxobacter dehalogenans (strain 2CP-C) TaxID=290397 RepID=Q2IEV2_ANADE|nr:NCS2 family permease [Anaeromyxobacter dehalogenans]ABC83112.1 Xanthine/uracil/vitamin C transporter [Anaeromyxobacter dehalogenans 2CP-C]